MKYPYNVAANNPANRGAFAGNPHRFNNHRYTVAPVHTRFDGIEWLVFDNERIDDDNLPFVIRQSASFDDAVSGLYLDCGE